MTSIRAPLAVALAFALGAGAAYAQGAPNGAMAGNSYVPSSHDAGCAGLFCTPPPPVDPAHPNQLAPPNCSGGLLCAALPYGMGQAFPAAETAADRQAHEQAAVAAAAAAAPPPEPVKPLRRHRKRVRSAAATPRPSAPAASAQ